MRLIAALPVSIAVSMLMAQTERPATHAVTAVRHYSLPGMTRVSVEVSGDFHFKSDRLHDPERIYFDLLDVRPKSDSRRGYVEQLTDKLVQRIRIAETKPGVTRVVLDLAASVEVTPSQLTNPDRLMIEVRASAPSAPATEPPPAILPPPAASMPPAVTAKIDAPRPEPPKSEPARVQPKPAVKDSEPEPVAAEPANTQLSRRDAAPSEPIKSEAARVEPAKVASVSEPKPLSAELAPPTARFGDGDGGKAARHTAEGDTSLVRALGLKVGRVVIDPGHGGHDGGTQGTHGFLEKDLVLDVAKRVGKLIEDRMGSEVIYTRTDDTFVPLEGRTALANDKRADLFLSIHANSSPSTRISGVEVYYLNFTDVKDALDVAARENAGSQRSIFELRDIIQKITLHDKAEESREFAGRLQTSLFGFESKNFPNSRNRGVKKAPFIVLIGADMPSVLAEIGFLSNPREESLLKRADYRQRLAEALFRGVSKYADSLSHVQQVAQQGPDTAKEAVKKLVSTPDERR